MKASSRLSELDFNITSGNLGINVLWFRAMQCSNDYVIERHTHSTIEFHFVYLGSSRVLLDNGPFLAQAGEFYLTVPGVYHRQENYKGYVEFSLNCELSVLGELTSETQYIVNILKNAECRPVADIAGATEIFYNALKEAYYQNTGFYNNISSLTVMLITATARAINGSTPAKYTVPVKQKKDDYRFIQIRNYIQDNISLPISTTDISRHMFLGEKQISRIVRKVAGISTKELMQELKFQMARAVLIERQDLTIRQIAEMLGFSSEYYFNQYFKRKEGYPPGVFRANLCIK